MEDSMHAIVVKVTLNDPDTGLTELRELVVPRVSKAPGFVTGYWTRKTDSGMSMIIFESEDAANSASEQVRSSVPPGVTLDDVEVREVVANA
jgi:hypothetical protein